LKSDIVYKKKINLVISENQNNSMLKKGLRGFPLTETIHVCFSGGVCGFESRVVLGQWYDG
jgi:hypothetical protein